MCVPMKLQLVCKECPTQMLILMENLELADSVEDFFLQEVLGHFSWDAGFNDSTF
jgi:hypothetical protein